MIRLALLVLGVSLCQLGAANARPDDGGLSITSTVPRFEPIDRASFPVSIPTSQAATTGYLIVYEDRENNNSKTIKLPVAVLKASNPAPNVSPVLYIGGGPGSSSMRVASYPGAYPFLKERDFIVFEQRGNRYAIPELSCPEYQQALEKDEYTNAEERALTRRLKAIASCKTRLESKGINRSAYSSKTMAEDIEDLRRVLGIEQWILYGVSYGTRVALSVLRDHPTSAEAAVLDSVIPPQARYDDESTDNILTSLTRLFEDCEANTACNAAFPALRQRFFKSGKTPNQLPKLNLSSRTGIRQAPELINAMLKPTAGIAKNDNAPSPQRSQYSWGLRLSVWCSESLPFSRRYTGKGQAGLLDDMDSALFLPAECDAWNLAPRPTREAQAVTSDVPALLISGYYDPATPPKWANTAAKTLSNSRVLVFRGQSHTPMQDWSGDGCAMAVATEFMQQPLLWLNNHPSIPDCVRLQTPPDFATSPQ